MNEFDPFSSGEIVRAVDSTEAQREIWLAAKYGGDQANLAYNESISLLLNGKIDDLALREAIVKLLGRHDALRSTFSSDGQTLIVNQAADLDFQFEDYSNRPDLEQESVSSAARKQEVSQVFNLVTGPLIRFRLLVFSPEIAELILTAHHIVCDGWSFGILVSELDALYSKNSDNNNTLEPGPSFAEYAVADRLSISGQAADSIDLFWNKTLGKYPPELDLPTDFSRMASMIELDGVPTRSVAAKRYDHHLSPDLSSAIHRIARSSGIGLPAFLLAAFSALLGRLSGQKDFIVGVPAAAQAFAGNYNLVGHCVQMLPIRLQIAPDSDYLDYCRVVKSSLLDGFENQGLTFGTILQRLRLERDPSRVPLIPVVFNVDQELDQRTLGDCDLKLISNPRVSENFEIFLNITPGQEQLQLELTYRTGLFKPGTIEQWCASFEAALTQIANQPDCQIGNILCLNDSQQKAQMSQGYTAESIKSWPDATIVDRIGNIAKANPERIATQDQSGSITYNELIERANRIASELCAAGVTKDNHVAICRTPGIDLVAAILGVWKAGCSYIPLDPSYPEKRLRYVLADTAVGVILGEGDKPTYSGSCLWLTSNGTENSEISSKALHDRIPKPNDIAYIIHTSGSTGDPKGVVVDHAALNNFIGAMMERPGIEIDNVLFAVTSLSFDISILEIFLPLSVGAKVILASTEQVRDGFALSRLLEQNGADFMQATPSGWRMLMDAGWQGNKSLKALCGGENLPLSLAKELSSKVGELWNMYGPTEATVWSTVQPWSEHTQTITLGEPIANTTVYVLDETMRFLPPGALGGELYLGGAGLAQGYLGRPELTAEKFIHNPFSHAADSILYRTGDLVRLDCDGKLHFIGRLDHQVKIRGFRIELGEVENALENHPDVGIAIATIHHDAEADSRLIAYVTCSASKSTIVADLYTLLAQELPPQCLPQHIVVIDRMPQTSNGKIDRNALPAPETKRSEKSGELVTDTQIKLAAIWCDLLRLELVGSTDDFFALGGHSMIAVRMLARVREQFGLELPLQAIFHDRNVANLSARIDFVVMAIRLKPCSAEAALEVFEF